MEETLDVMILGPIGAEVGRLLALPDCELLPVLKKKPNTELSVLGNYSPELCNRIARHVEQCGKCNPNVKEK